jgi:hypothetical protein
MRILAIVNGDYGFRHVENLEEHAPPSWKIQTWEAPTLLPPVIDYPEDYLPESLPSVDLILSLAENRGVAELLPEVAEMTGAQAVIAAIDNEAWLPRGLARQLRGWLEEMGVACATPKPLCSLTETGYGLGRRKTVEVNHPLIASFGRRFGQPDLKLTINPDTKVVTRAEVFRDAVCGCARFVAEGLIGVSVDEAEEKAGLLHHHYPCLASMGIDTDYGDTLMHVSGNLLKDNIGEQVKPFKQVRYLRPANRSETNDPDDTPSSEDLS